MNDDKDKDNSYHGRKPKPSYQGKNDFRQGIDGRDHPREERRPDPRFKARNNLIKSLSKTLAKILSSERETKDKWQHPQPLREESRQNEKEY